MRTNARPNRKAQQQRIIQSAADIFLEKGFAQASTDEIARRAKVSKRELYLNFANKRALLLAAITELQTGMQSRMEVRWSAEGDLAVVLRRAATSILKFILSDHFGKLIRVIAAESRHDPAIADQFMQLGPMRGRENTARFMKQQMAAGKLRKANPLLAADDFLDLVVSARLLTAIAIGQARPAPRVRTRVHHAVDAFLAIYSASAPSQD